MGASGSGRVCLLCFFFCFSFRVCLLFSLGYVHGSMLFYYMGSCQNYGPFWGTLNNRCRIILGTQTGTLILTTTHIWSLEGLRRTLEVCAGLPCGFRRILLRALTRGFQRTLLGLGFKFGGAGGAELALLRLRFQCFGCFCSLAFSGSGFCV